jgi:hypothetical protein
LNVTVAQVAEQYENGLRRMDFAISHSAHDTKGVQTASEILADFGSGRRIPALRDHRGSPSYPYTNRNSAQGFTIYRRIEEP